MEQQATDRYVSFCGIECDRWAQELMAYLVETLQKPETDSRWADYFGQKFAERQRMGQDELFFIGAQMNNLYSLFEACDDDAALEMLWRLEQQCC